MDQTSLENNNFVTPPASDDETHSSSPLGKKRKRSNFLNEGEKARLCSRYLEELEKGNKRSKSMLADEFDVHRETVSNVIGEFQTGNSFHRKPGSGRPTKMTPTKEAALRTVAVEGRGKPRLRHLAHALKECGESSKGVSKSTVGRYTKRNNWKRRKPRPVPLVTPKHISDRREFCSKKLKTPNRIEVHWDETPLDSKMNTGDRLLPEDVPPPVVPNANYLHTPTIQVITAIAKPYEKEGFDGKVMFEFLEKEKVAKKNSKYHKKGDVYMVPCTMDAAYFREIFLTKLVPAIQSKMNWASKVWVQVDNAAPHTGKKTIAQLNLALKTLTHPKMEIFCQPARSPDLNCNDKGFYASFKSRYFQKTTHIMNIEEIKTVAQETWEEYPKETLTEIFTTHIRQLKKVKQAKGIFLK